MNSIESFTSPKVATIDDEVPDLSASGSDPAALEMLRSMLGGAVSQQSVPPPASHLLSTSEETASPPARLLGLLSNALDDDALPASLVPLIKSLRQSLEPGTIPSESGGSLSLLRASIAQATETTTTSTGSPMLAAASPAVAKPGVVGQMQQLLAALDGIATEAPVPAPAAGSPVAPPAADGAEPLPDEPFLRPAATGLSVTMTPVTGDKPSLKLAPPVVRNAVTSDITTPAAPVLASVPPFVTPASPAKDSATVAPLVTAPLAPAAQRPAPGAPIANVLPQAVELPPNSAAAAPLSSLPPAVVPASPGLSTPGHSPVIAPDLKGSAVLPPPPSAQPAITLPHASQASPPVVPSTSPPVPGQPSMAVPAAFGPVPDMRSFQSPAAVSSPSAGAPTAATPSLEILPAPARQPAADGQPWVAAPVLLTSAPLAGSAPGSLPATPVPASLIAEPRIAPAPPPAAFATDPAIAISQPRPLIPTPVSEPGGSANQSPSLSPSQPVIAPSPFIAQVQAPEAEHTGIVAPAFIARTNAALQTTPPPSAGLAAVASPLDTEPLASPPAAASVPVVLPQATRSTLHEIRTTLAQALLAADEQPRGGPASIDQRPNEASLGQSILQSLSTQSSAAAATPQPGPVITSTTPHVERIEQVSALMSQMADRVLVTDPVHGQTPEVRIKIAEHIMPDTEVRVTRTMEGQLRVEFETVSPYWARVLNEASPLLAQRLSDQLPSGMPPQVVVQEQGGQPQDGRSRNRQTPWDLARQSAEG